jgi:hypothetical protein
MFTSLARRASIVAYRPGSADLLMRSLLNFVPSPSATGGQNVGLDHGSQGMLAVVIWSLRPKR